ncbi:DUF2730 family protein [Pararhodobacter sp.]|uniref:DUF2730 family protein n=1 Tax=Pararhodobacter sp. TaxID=2127056 RepID=UPI002FDC86F2
MTEVLDLSSLVAWVAALSLLLNFALTVWNLVASGSRENTKRIEGHASRLTALDQRVTSVELALRATPVKEDLHQLQLGMVQMSGDVSTMKEIMTRMESVLTRHEDHLLDGNKR